MPVLGRETKGRPLIETIGGEMPEGHIRGTPFSDWARKGVLASARELVFDLPSLSSYLYVDALQVADCLVHRAAVGHALDSLLPT